MATSENLEILRSELLNAKSIIEPQIEGLHDFARLNLKEETKPIVVKATEDFERRLHLINDGLTAIDNLSKDTYPDVSNRAVIEAVYEDLKDNVKTIEAAFSKFVPIAEATKATVIPGPPEPKP